MPRDIDLIRTQIMSLEERDFDFNNRDARGLETLDDLCEDLAGQPVAVAAPVVFAFIEKFADPSSLDASCDLGTPGPLVHLLERLPGYEPYLIESLRRRPAPLSLWMLNRVLNALPDGLEYDRLLTLLRSLADRSNCPVSVSTEAATFLEHQRQSRRGASTAD